MIFFYRHPDCRKCNQIQERLEDLVLAHRVIFGDKEIPATENIPKDSKLPLLADNGNFISGEKAILSHLDELEQFKTEWDKYQSDSCYCDEDGNVE